MDTSLIIPVISAISGFFVGLATPLFKWEIDKWRGRRQSKIKMIEDIRKYCENENFSRVDFVGSVIYSRIKHLFSNDLIYEIERKPSNQVSFSLIGSDTRVTTTPVDNILKEVAALEKDWGLV